MFGARQYPWVQIRTYVVPAGIAASQLSQSTNLMEVVDEEERKEKDIGKANLSEGSRVL